MEDGGGGKNGSTRDDGKQGSESPYGHPRATVSRTERRRTPSTVNTKETKPNTFSPKEHRDARDHERPKTYCLPNTPTRPKTIGGSVRRWVSRVRYVSNAGTIINVNFPVKTSYHPVIYHRQLKSKRLKRLIFNLLGHNQGVHKVSRASDPSRYHLSVCPVYSLTPHVQDTLPFTSDAHTLPDPPAPFAPLSGPLSGRNTVTPQPLRRPLCPDLSDPSPLREDLPHPRGRVTRRRIISRTSGSTGVRTSGIR